MNAPDLASRHAASAWAAPNGYVLDDRPAAAPLDRQAIADFLKALVEHDPRNRLPEGEHLSIWDAPLVGIARADDALFEKLKEPAVVGPVHRSPAEWLPGAKSVISYFMPYTRAVRATYPKKGPLPSLEWVSGRRNGEVFNNVARRALIRLLEKHGGQGVAPSNEQDYRAIEMRPMWSERHTAFIAGLGTFGIHGALITEIGCAGRIGSVITDLELEPTPRAYREVYEYCPYPSQGKCGACIPRCPVDAISPAGRDNKACVIQGRDTVGEAFKDWGYHSCGHCLTWLPCVDRIPLAGFRAPGPAFRGQSGRDYPILLKEIQP
jgi:epoxyqueuosine reductase QueG